MRINLTSIPVADQARALEVYTEALGFVKKTDLPAGAFRWLTVVSREDPEGVELLLEPAANPATRAYQKSLFDAGIPYTSFVVDDIKAEHERLSQLGIVFRVPPTETGPVTIAVFEDTCGNLIQIVQEG